MTLRDSVTGVHIIVEGRVQGVFYRASTQSTALSLGLGGWVRNLSDGSVEIRAEGQEDSLERLITWCWQGPPGAVVRDVRTTKVPVSKAFSGFQIRY